MVKRFIKSIFECRHKNALINSSEGYCPDCGKYLKKRYFVIRCQNCGIKRLGKKSFNKISPKENFCTCCGSSEFIIEKYEKLNFTDINYAIEVKETIENPEIINNLEIWVEENKNAEKENNKANNNPLLINEIKYITG